MRIDDICSPGMVPNNHRLRQETVRAIAFCETTGSFEKAVELQKYFREAIAYLDRELVSKDLPESEKPIVDHSAKSPFDDDIEPVVQWPDNYEVDGEIPDELFPVKPTYVPINKRGRK